MKIYIASLFSRREEMEGYAHTLKEAGHEITASWVYGGESGLSRTDIALLDLRDIDKADVVLSFTSPYGAATKGGGRHVEFGYGLATGKEAHVVGERENVFHHHPKVMTFTTLNDWVIHHEIIR